MGALRRGVSDMLRSCGADRLAGNTCDHVWEESLNVGKLEGKASRRSKIVLRWAHDTGLKERIEVRPEIFGSMSWYTVGCELAARFDDGSAAKRRDITAT